MEKQMLVRIVLNPGKYNHFIGLPLAFDAAESIYNSFFDQVPAKVRKAVEKILLKSGKYTQVN